MGSIFYDIVESNIKDAICTLNQLTDNTDFVQMEKIISKVVINAVHSINDYYERIDENMLTKSDDLWIV